MEIALWGGEESQYSNTEVNNNSEFLTGSILTIKDINSDFRCKSRSFG